jgi:hypothetical protein
MHLLKVNCLQTLHLFHNSLRLLQFLQDRRLQVHLAFPVNLNAILHDLGDLRFDCLVDTLDLALLLVHLHLLHVLLVEVVLSEASVVDLAVVIAFDRDLQQRLVI